MPSLLVGFYMAKNFKQLKCSSKSEWVNLYTLLCPYIANAMSNEKEQILEYIYPYRIWKYDELNKTEKGHVLHNTIEL